MGDRRWKTERGAAATETALACTLLIAALVGLLDLGRSWYVRTTLQAATRTAARSVASGFTIAGLTREQSIERIVRDRLPVSAETTIEVHSQAIGRPPAIGAGAPGEIVIVRAHAEVPLISPYLKPFFEGGRYVAFAETTALNEDFTSE